MAENYLISQVDDDVQALRVDHIDRYIENDSTDWQFLFGPNSDLVPSFFLLKEAGQFDTNSFNDIKLISYLYNNNNGSIASGAACTFNVYRVSVTGWNEILLGSFNGTEQDNHYFFTTIPLTSLTPADLDGDNTIMVECVFTRLSDIYRERMYLNHLGSYDSIVRLRKEVQWLDITKQDE